MGALNGGTIKAYLAVFSLGFRGAPNFLLRDGTVAESVAGTSDHAIWGKEMEDDEEEEDR